MNQEQVKVLIVEDNPGDVRFIQEMLSDVTEPAFVVKTVERLSEGLEVLDSEDMDIILLDLSLPDSHGLDTFTKINIHAPEIPIVVLTGLSDSTLATKAVHEGAQDYLVKGQVDGHMLSRSMRYAIERHQLQMALRSLSLVDDLTGLYNRRGFLTLANQHLKVAQRTERGFLVIYADLDGLKKINDSCGHQAGDNALVDVAKILKNTFRKSDIIARIGGDEFVMLARCSSDDKAVNIIERLQQQVQSYNTQGNTSCNLSISVGIAAYDPKIPSSIDDLLIKADKLMYVDKRNKYGGEDTD